jgi:hypothetical protein
VPAVGRIGFRVAHCSLQRLTGERDSGQRQPRPLIHVLRRQLVARRQQIADERFGYRLGRRREHRRIMADQHRASHHEHGTQDAAQTSSRSLRALAAE